MHSVYNIKYQLKFFKCLMMPIILCPWNVIYLHFWGCFLPPVWILRKFDREIKLLNFNLFSVWHQQVLCRHYIIQHKQNREVCVTNLPRSYTSYFLKNGQILDKPRSASLSGFQIRCFQIAFCVVGEKLKCSHLVGKRVGPRPFGRIIHNRRIILKFVFKGRYRGLDSFEHVMNRQFP